MKKANHRNRAGKKVRASQYYKRKSTRRISRKKRDRDLYRKTSNDAKLRHNIKLSADISAGKIAETAAELINAEESDGMNAYEAIKAAAAFVPEVNIQGRIDIQKSEQEDDYKGKGSRTVFQRGSINKGEQPEDAGQGERIIHKEAEKPENKDANIRSETSVNDGNHKYKAADIKKDRKSDLKKEELLSEKENKGDSRDSQKSFSVNNKTNADSDSIRKRKLEYAAYEEYVRWKKEQKKQKKETPRGQDGIDTEKNSAVSAEKKKGRNSEKDKEKYKNEGKNRKEIDNDDEGCTHINRKNTRKTKRKSRAVDPIVMNAKRNLSMVKHEVTSMPVKTMRVVMDDISADELAMRAGRGIAGYMSGIYGSAMKSVAAVGKSLGMLAAGVIKDMLIAAAPVLLGAAVIMFMIFILLSPLQPIIMGGDSDGETQEQDMVLAVSCSEALKNEAERLKQKILSDNPDAVITVLPVNMENADDLYKIMEVVMAMNFIYTDDEEWLESPDGKAELNKYAGLMCHRMSREEIDKYKEDSTEETPAEELTTGEITSASGEITSGEPTVTPIESEIFIGYYTYAYLLENGYLSDIEEVLQE